MSSDTAARGARYRVDGTVMLLVPPQALLPNDSITLQLDWSFRIPRAGASGRMGYDRDNMFFLAYWYPQMRVYDDVTGWHTDPFLGNAEFYHGFADYRLTVEAPANWLVHATGRLQNPEAVLSDRVLQRMRLAENSDSVVQVVGRGDFNRVTRGSGRIRWRFTSDRVRDVSFSATRQSVWDATRTRVGDRDGDGRVDYARVDAVYRETAPRWRNAARYGQHALDFFSRYTGFPYPWPHMTQVEGGGIIGGGMEFPMMTLIGDYNERGDSALYYVVAHELAHMWIPMIVSNNERRDAWLDEGSTTFAENQSRMEFFPGMDHNQPDMESYLRVARAGDEGEIMRRSDFHYPGPAYVTATYSKPASVLVALRAVLGEETFNRAYRSFVDRWAYRHPTAWDFFNTFESVSGRDLDWFWRSWYHETWVLDQAVASVTQDRRGVTIVVEDRGQIPMPAYLAITRANGESERREIPVQTWLDGATRATITLPAGPQVVRVEIDPDRHYPDIDRSNNVWTP